MKRILGFESILYIFIVLGIASTGGYLIFSKPEIKRNKSASKESLGYVRPLGVDVRMRADQENSWNSLGKETAVFADDRVFTGSASSAHVKLRGSQEFTVEPNSLIKITDESAAPLFDLENGSFFGELRKGAKFFIKSADGIAEIESTGATVRIESQNKKIKLIILKGEASVQTDKQVKKIKANQEMKIDKSLQVAALAISPLAPEAGKMLWQNDNQPVKFRWKSSKPSQPVVVEVGLSPLFEQPIFREQTTGQELYARLNPGQAYFWRVIEAGSGQQQSATSSFSYYTLRAPKVVEHYVLPVKVDGAGVTLKPVNFRWLDPSLSESCELQISRTQDFSKKLYSRSTITNNLPVSGLMSGSYYWRVISRHPSRRDLTSTIAQIELQTDEPAPVQVHEIAEVQSPPTPLPVKPLVPDYTPLEKPQISEQNLIFELADQSPDVKLHLAKHADRHELELSTFKDFRKKRRFSVFKQNWKWNEPEIGQYFVRLKAVRGEETTYSATKSMRILLAAPTLEVEMLNPLPKHLSNLRLSIQRHSLAAETEIQISNNANFGSAQILKTKGQIIEQPSTAAGAVFIRARHLNAQGWPVSRFSETQEQVILPVIVEVRKLAAVKKPEQTIKATTETNYEPMIFKKPRVKAWAGVGGDYLRFTQTGSDSLATGTFSKMMAPALMVGLNFKITNNSTMDLQYHDGPGEVTAGTDTTVDKTQYHWRAIIAEWQYDIFHRGRVRYQSLFGAQIHQVPFLYVDALGTASVLQNELQNLSVGLKLSYKIKSYEYEGLLRYQHLLGAKSLDGATFNASSRLMFDGSIGVTKYFRRGLRLGAVWFGQSQNLNYDFTKDGYKSTGSQSFFGSILQLRLGYDFY